VGIYLFGQSLREYLRPGRFLPWIAIAIVLGGLALLWPRISPHTILRDRYANLSTMFVFHILALASAVYTAAIVSQEVEQKTIVYLLTRPVARWKLLLSRYVASSLVVCSITIICAVSVSFGVFGARGLSNPLLFKDIEAFFFGAFAYGGAFMLVSLVINRALLVCLLYAFGWESTAPNMPGELYRLSIFSYVQALASHPEQKDLGDAGKLMTGELGTNALTRGSGLITMLALSALACAASAWWFTHFEYVPREDAE